MDRYMVDKNKYGLKDNNPGMLYLDINFRNNNPLVQIIESRQSFTIHACWAGIGGFIGIFIGVSLSQLPQMISCFFNVFRKAIE